MSIGGPGPGPGCGYPPVYAPFKGFAIFFLVILILLLFPGLFGGGIF